MTHFAYRKKSSSFPLHKEKAMFQILLIKELKGSGFGRGEDKLITSGKKFRVRTYPMNFIKCNG
jgi:hypothetical protein